MALEHVVECPAQLEDRVQLRPRVARNGPAQRVQFGLEVVDARVDQGLDARDPRFDDLLQKLKKQKAVVIIKAGRKVPEGRLLSIKFK